MSPSPTVQQRCKTFESALLKFTSNTFYTRIFFFLISLYCMHFSVSFFSFPSEWVLMKSADCEVDANLGSSSRYVLYQLSMRTHLGLCASKQVSKLSEAKTLYCRNVALKYS